MPVHASAPFDLHGTRALVTGAGSANGIGFAAARMLAQLGAAVYLVGHSTRVLDRVKELTAQGVEAAGVNGDLADESFVETTVAAAAGALGGIDVLVNNAGMTSVARSSRSAGEIGSIDQMTTEGWRAALDRNVTSMFLVTRAALPHLRRSSHGRIISVSSLTGPVMAMANDVAYASAKAAMAGLTRAVAIDEARHGIAVNAVAPGWIATESATDHEHRQGLTTPMGRSGTASEVASAICWLASRDAGYVTGQIIVIDGGNSIREER